MALAQPAASQKAGSEGNSTSQIGQQERSYEEILEGHSASFKDILTVVHEDLP